jgi:cell division protein FtsB
VVRKAASSSSRSDMAMPNASGPVRRLLSPAWLSLLLMGAGIFLVVMLALAIVNERGFLAMWRMQRDVTQLASMVRSIEQENQDLWRNIERLHSDMGYIEKIAREELGLVRPGELVFEFVE